MKTSYTSGQLVKLTTLFEQKGVSPEKFQAALATGIAADFAEALAEARLEEIDRAKLREVLGLHPLLPKPAIISLDHGLSLKKLLSQAGLTGCSVELLSETFSTESGKKGVVQYETRYFCFNDDEVFPNDALDLIVNDQPWDPFGKRWQPAELPHLLAFASTYPDEQRKYTIVAFGQEAPNKGLFCLDGTQHMRRLYEAGRTMGGTWGDARYLAVRQVERR